MSDNGWKSTDSGGMVLRLKMCIPAEALKPHKRPFSRRTALKYAWRAINEEDFRDRRIAADWLRTAWRGWITGTIYNAGV